MDSIRLRAQDSAGSDRCHRQQRCEAVKHLADPHVLNFPLAWLLWFVVLAVAMYFARLPAPRVLLSLALALHRALRLMARSALPAEQRLQARNREVLLAAGARRQGADHRARVRADRCPGSSDLLRLRLMRA